MAGELERIQFRRPLGRHALLNGFPPSFDGVATITAGDPTPWSSCKNNLTRPFKPVLPRCGSRPKSTKVDTDDGRILNLRSPAVQQNSASEEF